MAVRMCPHCNTEIPAHQAVALSNDIGCPKCEARLEVTLGARTIATLCGLAAAAIVWWASKGASGELGEAAQTLYAFLAFGVISPLVLMATANLQNAPIEPVLVADGSGHGSAPASGHGAAPAGGHGGSHH